MGGTNLGTLALLGTVSSGFLIFCLNRGLKMRDDKRAIAGLLWYAGGLIPLMGVCLLWAGMEGQALLPQRIALFVVGAALGGIALLMLGEYIRPTAAQQTAPGMTNGPSINTWNQSGGTNTINIGPTKLTFQPAIANELVSKLPRGKPVSLVSVGSSADQLVANEYQVFLQSQGFTVVRSVIGMMAPPPDHKIAIGDVNAAQVTVIIAPSAN